MFYGVRLHLRLRSTGRVLAGQLLLESFVATLRALVLHVDMGVTGGGADMAADRGYRLPEWAITLSSIIAVFLGQTSSC